jgi:glutamyl-tRNA synthetase
VNKPDNVRVRFAPSPTGMMHLGNVRAALLNYLFAKKYKGSFILRIEDTDTERNFDLRGAQIISDLLWLGLEFDEGPEKGGKYAPYFQSERLALYKKKLEELEEKGKIYRCFCTPEELEKKRQRQIALKMPPRYDRTCLNLSPGQVEENLKKGLPFIWRLITAQDKIVTITDLAHGKVTFNLKELSDLPLTRSDGSFTFIFANCIDDIDMRITHIIRGEDHLTNTAGQIVLYESFGANIPLFWHLPIICNAEGKKLSKRDFGFSLNDLRNAGYLPEAIVNYLGIIGGSFEKEILSLDELAQAYNFENMHSTGQIRYDVEKLKWVNHKWISQYDEKKLVARCLPFLTQEFPQAAKLSDELLLKLVTMVKTDVVTLPDISKSLGFYFKAPDIKPAELVAISLDKNSVIVTLLKKHLSDIHNPATFTENVKKDAQAHNVPIKELWHSTRLILTGSTQGLGIKEIIELLGSTEAEHRIRAVVSSHH